MLVKARGIPKWIQCLEALLRLLSPTHPLIPKLKTDLKKRHKGYKGEKDADYYAQLLDSEKFLILHDLRLTYNGLAFQIDTLILTTRFFLIIEIKSLGEELFFNGDTGQLTIFHHETLSGADNPLIQALNHCSQLKGWLKEHKFPHMPIEYLAIISNPQSVIKCSSKAVARHVGTSKGLPQKVMELSEPFRREILPAKELKRIARALKKAHTPEVINILKTYRIEMEELLTGVPCPKCGSRPMLAKKGGWRCPQCRKITKDAHIQVIKDYLLVGKNEWSLQECCRILEIDSPKVAKRLLANMDLIPSGNTKARRFTVKT